jgi:hypothetical protein
MAMKTRADVMAFIDGALARGLTVEEIMEAIEADPAMMRAACTVALEDIIRKDLKRTTAEPPDGDEPPPVMDDAGLLDFLKRRMSRRR